MIPETHRVMRLLAPSRGTHTYWTDKDPVIFEGVIGLTKDRLFPGSLEYFIGDGAHKYSELPKYGGAEASILSKAYTLVLRNADGKMDSDSLPDATPEIPGAVKASTNQQANTVVKSDNNGSLDGWKSAISDAIENPDAGLVKNADGTLGVDFDRMPTDKFEALLKSLKMLIPLTQNLQFYVDTADVNAGDTIIDGRGTQEKPFKTIQACVNYVTNTYSIGKYHIDILIGAGTYNETVTLPNYSYSSGYIALIPKSGQKDVFIVPPQSSNGFVGSGVFCTGGIWRVYYLTVNRVEHATTVPGQVARCFGVENALSRLLLYGCSVNQSMPSNTPLDTENYEVRLFSADVGGSLYLEHGIYPYTINAQKVASSQPGLGVFVISRNGTLYFRKDALDGETTTPDINCSGSCDVFLNMSANGSTQRIGSRGVWTNFVGTMTGKKYNLASGAHGAAAGSEFPGDIAGTVDTSTYCWLN